MPTYILKSTTSAGPTGADFTRDIEVASAASATLAVSTAASATEESVGSSRDAPLPGQAGTFAVGTWTVEVNITVAAVGITIGGRVERYTSGHVSAAASANSLTPASASTTGAKSFPLNSVDLGQFAATDYLVVFYRFTNANTMSTSVTIEFNTTNCEIITPAFTVAGGSLVVPSPTQRIQHLLVR